MVAWRARGFTATESRYAPSSGGSSSHWCRALASCAACPGKYISAVQRPAEPAPPSAFTRLGTSVSSPGSVEIVRAVPAFRYLSVMLELLIRGARVRV